MILPSSFTFKGGIDGVAYVRHIIQVLRKLNVHSFEVGFTQSGEISMESTPVSLAEIVSQLKQNSMDIAAMSTTLLSGQDFYDHMGKPNIKTMQIVNSMIEVASYLEIPYISFHCSSARKIQEFGYEQAVRYETECMIQLAEYAQQKGVVCCLENYIDGLLCYPTDMMGFLMAANTPALQACMDIGNAIYSGTSERWIPCLKDRIKLVHFSDVKLRKLRGVITEFVEPGKGIIDFHKVYNQLMDCGFNGQIVLESYARPQQDDMEVIAKLLETFQFVQ